MVLFSRKTEDTGLKHGNLCFYIQTWQPQSSCHFAFDGMLTALEFCYAARTTNAKQSRLKKSVFTLFSFRWKKKITSNAPKTDMLQKK
jgi:hypothetical protein